MVITNSTGSALVKSWLPEEKPQLKGYTPKIFKREVLGECTFRASGRVTFDQAMQGATRHQPGNPYNLNPATPPGKFQAVVRDEMRGFGLQRSENLGLFTGIDSPLEYMGVGGFFIFEGIIITVSCTLDSAIRYKSRALVHVTGDDFLTDFGLPAIDVAKYIRRAVDKGQKGFIS